MAAELCGKRVESGDIMNKSDIDLIAAIAKKFGWKKRIPDTRFPDMCVWFFEGKAYESHKLPSVDACLALLVGDKPESMDWIEIQFMGEWRVNISCGTKASGYHIDKSLPRAILLALLEVE
ncbi:hypothetical protein LCGC14_0428530 [marine sediment metagenome]|uniref:Uncharacterized protein n=1 Tax=marine sediment metagenome TaxID=412755 RepID=A0A0F9VY98_9ZZZZ